MKSKALSVGLVSLILIALGVILNTGLKQRDRERNDTKGLHSIGVPSLMDVIRVGERTYDVYCDYARGVLIYDLRSGLNVPDQFVYAPDTCNNKPLDSPNYK